ncbi:hypothetical protein K469DRAFT_725453 [Zopfia rhizophila CBS 207.26]|uniref:Purine and uridine phosphorylase n=1 Tax=Zopfia rhizophila CBS 207.26 TaxID=1314779 RepID=A0A6A6E8R7_9PEZI|nr:hypothetical protein K469DRAFT_725453 [Zopfia rhizophila CBS 207.26]
MTTEFVTAQTFLNEEYKGLIYVSQNDNSVYKLGTIGKYNVVMAVLLDKEYGTNSAACVARDIIHTFSNIRIGLMVSVSSGVLSLKHNIYLSNIIVMNGLKADYERKGLRKKYSHPDPKSNILYRSEIVHAEDTKELCITVCSHNPSMLVSQEEQAEEDDDPEIHYSLITLVNQLMKDATFRDTLAKEKDVLCFEIETAGLMNQFPYLIIYRYAAITAAAYAKDILYQIPPNRLEAEKRISNIIYSS